MVTDPTQNASDKERRGGNPEQFSLLRSAQESVSQFVGNVNDQSRAIGGGVIKNVRQTLPDFLARPVFGDEDEEQRGNAQAEWKSTISNPDWRVKLSIPESFKTSTLLAPLINSGAFIFPYTPTIILGHSANYNNLQPVHTNYPFHIYENSAPQEIVITGDFTVENAADGEYWIAAIHYLRSVTKMFYGNGANSGSPPPLVMLNGYGDYVFKDVPCVVTNFTVDLPSDVDYVAVQFGDPESGLSGNNENASTLSGDRGKATTWAPTQSLVTVTLKPTYSRKQVSRFNLNDFVNGKMVTNGRGFI